MGPMDGSEEHAAQKLESRLLRRDLVNQLHPAEGSVLVDKLITQSEVRLKVEQVS